MMTLSTVWLAFVPPCWLVLYGEDLYWAAELDEWQALLSPTSWRRCLASWWLPFLPPLGLLALFALGAALGWALRWLRLPQRTHPFA